jgi:hypothetical protein
MHGRLLPLVFVALVASTTIAYAVAPNAPGVNLRWDQCYADGGAWNKSFACDTNTGTDRMIGSFELASEMASPATGLEVYMNIASVGTLPAWWHFRNAGTCRQTSLSAVAVPPVAVVNCPDWSGGQGAGGIGAYQIGHRGPETAYLQGAFAVPLAAQASLQAGQEYFAFAIGINHAKTVGTGACAGCQAPVVVFLSAIRITTQVSAHNVMLTRGANWLGSQYVSWQHGYPTNVTHGCGMTFGGLGCAFPYVDFDVVPYDATSARPSTWGQVKSLYR